MEVSSDEALGAARPMLQPLLAAASLPRGAWKQMSAQNGYTVSETPPKPDLQLPLKCYRTDFAVSADLTSFHRVLNEEKFIRESGANLKELRVLEQQVGQTLLYISYSSPWPWVLAPRDFCVKSTTLHVTLPQLTKAYPGLPIENLLQRTNCPSIGDGSVHHASRPEGGNHSVYLQSSVSASEPHVLLPDADKTTYVRGTIYCFGYVAYQDPNSDRKLHVTNYCCVDPAGKIPKWLVAATVEENTRKMRRIASLAEAVTATADSLIQCSATSQISSPYDETCQSAAAKKRKNLVDGVAGAREGTPVPLSPSPRRRPNDPRSPPYSQVTVTAAPSTPPYERPSSPLQLHEALDGAPSSAGRSTPHGLSARSRSSLSSSSPRLPSSSPALASTPNDIAMERLSLLARSMRWKILREVAEVEYSELDVLPKLLRDQAPGCHAMRVAVSLKCTLDAVKTVLGSEALAPEIDAELTRLTMIPKFEASCKATGRRLCGREGDSPTTASSRTPLRVFGAEVSANTPASVARPVASARATRPHASHLLHYQFAVGPLFPSPWEMWVCCWEEELSSQDGGALGFHMSGAPAATYVWLGTTAGTHTTARTLTDGYATLHPLVMAVTAVAIPRSAVAVRLSFYLLFGEESLPLQRPSGRWRCCSSKKRSTAERFRRSLFTWMGNRMQKICHMCEKEQEHRTGRVLLPLDKQPLLQFLYTVHCNEGSAALESTEAKQFGDVLAHTIRWGHVDGSSPWGRSYRSEAPLLLVLSTVFPCSLAQLRAYMRATPPRSRYALAKGVCLCEELPSPPGFSIVSMAYGPDNVSFPGVRLSFLEAFGELPGDNPHWPTLVLSCVDVEGTACGGVGGCTDSDNVEATAAFANERFERGRVLCSGFVATAVEVGSDRESPKPASGGRESYLSDNSLTSHEFHSMVSVVDDRTRDEEEEEEEEKEKETAALEGPGEAVAVVQYLSIDLPCSQRFGGVSTGIPSDCVEEQVCLLQRFRSAACSWSATSTCW